MSRIRWFRCCGCLVIRGLVNYDSVSPNLIAPIGCVNPFVHVVRLSCETDPLVSNPIADAELRENAADFELWLRVFLADASQALGRSLVDFEKEALVRPKLHDGGAPALRARPCARCVRRAHLRTLGESEESPSGFAFESPRSPDVTKASARR